MPDIEKLTRAKYALLEIPWLWDRRTWIMYLIVNGLKQDWRKLIQIRPDNQW
jgi:hypothetical protein